MSDELNEDRLSEVNGGAGEKYIYYTVECGDTLTRIAIRFETSVQTLIDLNPMTWHHKELRTGWILMIPQRAV